MANSVVATDRFCPNTRRLCLLVPTFASWDGRRTFRPLDEIGLVDASQAGWTSGRTVGFSFGVFTSDAM